MGLLGGDGKKRRKREEEERRRQEEQRQREEAEAERQREQEELEREREEEAKAKEAERQAQEEARQKALEEMASETEAFAQDFGKPQEPQAQSTQQSQRDRQVQETVGEANRAIDRGLGRGQSTAQNAAQRTRQGLQGATLPQSQATQGQASSVLADAAAPNRQTPRPATFAPSRLQGSGAGPVRGGMLGGQGSMQTAATASPPARTPQNAPGAPGQNPMAQGQPQTPAAPPAAPTQNQNVVQMQRELSEDEQSLADRATGRVDRAFGNRVGGALRGVEAQYNQNRMMLDDPNGQSAMDPSEAPVPQQGQVSGQAPQTPAQAPGQAPGAQPSIGQDTPENQVRRTENMGLYDPWAGTGQEIEATAEGRALAQLAGEGPGDVEGIDIGEISVDGNRSETPEQALDVEQRLQNAQEAVREGVESPRVYDEEGNLIQGQARPPRTANPVIQQAVAEGRIDPTVAPELEDNSRAIDDQIQRDLEAGNITEEQAADIRAFQDGLVTGQQVAVPEDLNATPPSAQEATEGQAPAETSTAEGEEERVENADGLTAEEVQEILNDPEPPIEEEVTDSLRPFAENDAELREMQNGLAAVRAINARLAETIESQLTDSTPTTFEEEIDRARANSEKARKLSIIGKILAFGLILIGHASGSEDMMGLGVLVGKLFKGISTTNREAAEADLRSLEQQRQNVQEGEMSDLQRLNMLAQARMSEVEQLNRMRGQRQADERLRLQDQRDQNRFDLDQRRLQEQQALDDPDSDLSQYERENLRRINADLQARGLTGFSEDQIEGMTGRAARGISSNLSRRYGNRDARRGLGGGAGPTGSTAVSREDVSQNDEQLVAEARRLGVRPILDARGKLNRAATEARVQEEQELGNNGDGTWTLNRSHNLRSDQPRDPSVRRAQIANVNNIVAQHRAGMTTLSEMERLGRELGLDSPNALDRIRAMGQGYMENAFAGLTERMMGIVSEIKRIGVINPSEAPAVEQALPSPINWRNITSQEQFDRALGAWRRALNINTESQLYGNEVMSEDVRRFTAGGGGQVRRSSGGQAQTQSPQASQPAAPARPRRNVAEMSDEELERRRRELSGGQ